MLSRATFLVRSAFAIPTHEVIDLVPVLVDQSFDVLAARPSLRTRVRDRTSQSHVVSNEIGACRILERILHVSLLHLEVTVDIASVVRLVAFRHLMMLRLVWSAWPRANWRVAYDYRANHRPTAELSLDQQHEISATFPETVRIADPQPIGIHAAVLGDAIREPHVLTREHSETRMAQRGRRQHRVAITVQLAKLSV